jgi:hypothetical protein
MTDAKTKAAGADARPLLALQPAPETAETTADPSADADIAPADDDAPADNAQADDALEIEHEGRRYSVPKALKDAFLRQADYTRKTQELAEQRRAFEQDAAQQRAALGQDLDGHARLVALNDQIGAYERIDWDTLEREDPVRAQALWRDYTQLKDGRAQLLGRMQLRAEHAALDAQRESARRAEEGHAVLARDVPGWSPELANKLGAFAHTEFGFTPEEISSVADPRMVKVLHLAQLGRQSQQQEAAAKKAAAAEAAAPIGKVGSSAPASRNPDRMSTDEWMSFERDRLRKRKN